MATLQIRLGGLFPIMMISVLLLLTFNGARLTLLVSSRYTQFLSCIVTCRLGLGSGGLEETLGEVSESLHWGLLQVISWELQLLFLCLLTFDGGLRLGTERLLHLRGLICRSHRLALIVPSAATLSGAWESLILVVTTVLRSEVIVGFHRGAHEGVLLVRFYLHLLNLDLVTTSNCELGMFIQNLLMMTFLSSVVLDVLQRGP